MDKLYIIRNIVSPLNTIKAHMIVCFDDTMKENRERGKTFIVSPKQTQAMKNVCSAYVSHAHI